jgi:hypothetical protein
MNITNHHERTVTATPDRVAALLADFDGVWPTQVSAAPQLCGVRLFQAGPMLWQEFDRPAALRAFRVVRPEELEVDHWFELEQVDRGTVVRHRLEGRALGRYEHIWSERIEPFHNRVMEALLDNVQDAVSTRAGDQAG